MTRAALVLAEIAFGIALANAALGAPIGLAIFAAASAALVFTVLHQLIERDRP